MTTLAGAPPRSDARSRCFRWRRGRDQARVGRHPQGSRLLRGRAQRSPDALRLHEAGMIKFNPNKITPDGTDWRFLDELKRELKT